MEFKINIFLLFLFFFHYFRLAKIRECMTLMRNNDTCDEEVLRLLLLFFYYEMYLILTYISIL